MPLAKVAALIAAAGKGQRMGAKINKQFLLLNGKPILSHTIEVFDKHQGIDEILVITAAQEKARLQEILAAGNFNKDIKIVIGGQERQDSVYNGLLAVKESGLVIIHDGARPFLTSDLIDQVIEAAIKWQAV